jgi:hypothetical protein
MLRIPSSTPCWPASNLYTHSAAKSVFVAIWVQSSIRRKDLDDEVGLSVRPLGSTLLFVGSGHTSKAMALQPPEVELNKKKQREGGKKRKQRETKKNAEGAEKEAPPEKDSRNAKPLHAPAYVTGQATNINEFTPKLRKLVSDEFGFQDAKRQLFRTTFSRRNLHSSPTIKYLDCRNALVFPGAYDFERKQPTWLLHLWHIQWDEKKIGASTYPQVIDTCALSATFKLDEPTARKWRDAFERETLEITVWYRPVKVQVGTWTDHPRWTDGTQAHHIIMDVDVVHFEFELDAKIAKPKGVAPKKPSGIKGLIDR